MWLYFGYLSKFRHSYINVVTALAESLHRENCRLFVDRAGYPPGTTPELSERLDRCNNNDCPSECRTNSRYHQLHRGYGDFRGRSERNDDHPQGNRPGCPLAGVGSAIASVSSLRRRSFSLRFDWPVTVVADDLSVVYGRHRERLTLLDYLLGTESDTVGQKS